jgi:hypothetical protein
MSRLIEGLARRLVEREAVPRRDLLTGRRAAATAGVVVPLVGAVGGATGAVAAGAPRAGVAAGPAKAPPLPGRSDLRAIHIAVMSSEARLKSQLIALVDALKTPASDGTFSSAANDALAVVPRVVPNESGDGWPVTERAVVPGVVVVRQPDRECRGARV